MQKYEYKLLLIILVKKDAGMHSRLSEINFQRAVCECIQ